VVTIKPDTPFEHIGGISQAKAAIRGFTIALTEPDLYRKWGISPPRGILLYGPRGTGKTMLARALATSAGAIFYHLKLMNLTSKFGPNTGELLQEIINIAKTEGKAVVYLDEANALSLEHLLPPAQARESSARLVAALCEKLDGLDESARMLVVASTNRTDSVDRSLVEPGRLDRLVEAVLPDGAAQQEILQLVRERAEAKAGRPLFDEIDYRSLLPPMGGMSGAEISEVFRRALEQKVQAAGEGQGRRAGHHPGSPPAARRLSADPGGRGEDPLRPVPLIGGPSPSMPSHTSIRVRYKDTDTMSVVYYGNYLTYFEVARVEYLRERGLPMSEVNRRVHMPVVEACVHYDRPRSSTTSSTSPRA
jgi:SpoVK/Ycf46/Vps4 family AAA+-type ATPase